MTNIKFWLWPLLLVAAFAAFFIEFALPPAFHLEVAALVVPILLVVWCVAVPLRRCRRARGIGVASLLRRTTRFACLLTLALLWLVPGAEAQFSPARLRAWTNVPSIVTANAASNIQANAFTLQRDKGVGVLIRFAGTNANTAALTLQFEVSADGSNWTTTLPFSFTSIGNGTTAVLNWTNLTTGDVARLNNIFQIRPRYLTNAHTASVFPSNIWWTYNAD